MKCLVLFYTQGEAGAPQYLSRAGEMGAQSLSETLLLFLQDNFKLDIKTNFNERARSLNQDEKWKQFSGQDNFLRAMEESLALYSDILLIAGNDARTLKTAQYISENFALPICVNDKLDKYQESKPFIGNLTQELPIILSQFINKNPSVLIVGTSIVALLEWIRFKTDEKDYNMFCQILNMSSENDTIPAVFVAGYENSDGVEKWFFDLPYES